MSLRGTLATLSVAVALAAGGTLTPEALAVTAEVDAERRLHDAILAYIAERNPKAPMHTLQGFPGALLVEASRADLDHCLALAQAEIESAFRPDAVGRAGEIGLFQMLPSTAALLEPLVGTFRRPAPGRRDLGDLADPIVNTRFAMAYLRDIRVRKPAMEDALTEYNSGPRPPGRRRPYYGRVMGAYGEIRERAELRCRPPGHASSLEGLDPSRQRQVLVRDAAGVVGPEGQRHLAVADVDVRMVAGALGERGNSVDEEHRLLEVAEAPALRDRAVGARPARQPAQRLGQRALVEEAHARVNFWSDRIARGGLSWLPREVHDTSAT